MKFWAIKSQCLNFYGGIMKALGIFVCLLLSLSALAEKKPKKVELRDIGVLSLAAQD